MLFTKKEVKSKLGFHYTMYREAKDENGKEISELRGTKWYILVEKLVFGTPTEKTENWTGIKGSPSFAAKYNIETDVKIETKWMTQNAFNKVS